MSKTTIIPILAVLAVLCLPLYWAAFPVRVPQSEADGVYQNACCGSLSINNGTLEMAGRSVTYVVERDKQGRYVLPSIYVGVADGSGFDIDRRKYPMKLRIDDARPPRSIQLWGRTVAYDFVRKQ